MNLTYFNSMPLIGEVFILTMACIVLMSSVFVKNPRSIILYSLTQIALVGALILTIITFPKEAASSFSGHYLLDPLSSLLKIFILGTTSIAFLYSRGYLHARDIPEGEYYSLGLFTVLGMQILVSASSLLTVFLGLELLSLPLYAMVALRRDHSNCLEAAMKYFVTGALATGMLLYGISMLYGATQTLEIHQIADAVANLSNQQDYVLVMGLVFVMSGVAFKIGAAPFHPWVPDVYQGAPTSVTLFIGTATKIAALGFLFRIVIETMPGLQAHWQKIFVVIAIASMGLGNFAAIVQTNIKRMLGYSAIAHMGYMSLGIIAANNAGYAAATFYMISYAIMSLGAFGLLTILSHTGYEAENIIDLRGLNVRNPWLAFVMLLIMFSMAGIPPTIGFFAKLGVLEALVGIGYVWLAVLALFFAIIGAYYYIAVVKTMYFEEPDEISPIRLGRTVTFVMMLNGFAVLFFGMFPSQLIDWCRSVFVG